jgi:epoxyqueuosine reductase
MVTASEVKDYGVRLGLDIVRIASAEPFADYPKMVKERMGKGYIPPESLANEEILRRAEEFADPRTSLPSARSIVSVAMCLLIPATKVDPEDPTPRGRIAHHNWRDFYGDMHAKRDMLAKFIEGKGARCSQKPLLPLKQVAARAGVGAFGCNCLISTERLGTWVCLDAIVTDADIKPDPPVKSGCGRCRACIDACPTRALVAPYTLDIGRCINHLTSSALTIPLELRARIGDRINGCDACQEACPRNWDVAPATRGYTDPRERWGERPPLASLLEVGEKEFNHSFADLDWYKPGPVYLHRNVVIAMGNIGDPVSVPPLGRALRDGRPLVRAHAAWALGRIGGAGAKRLLDEAAKHEDDEAVAEEIDLALDGL